MNYISSNYNNATYFYPDNSGSVGGFVKAPQAKTLVTFDYSNILSAGVTLKSISFVLDVQTNPQLMISGMEIAGSQNILSWLISAGMGGISYNLSVNATLSDTSVRTDVVTVEVTGDDAMGCCNPSGSATGMMPIPAGYQQAGLAQNGVYASSLIRYFVSDTPPLGANVMDQWYDTVSDQLLEYITDGKSTWWYSPATEVIAAGPRDTLYYPASQGQTAFYSSLPDAFGATYLMTTQSLVSVYVNGVMYMPVAPSGAGDYTLNLSSSLVTLKKGLVANDIVTMRIGQVS